MSVAAMHPGERIAAELEELGMAAPQPAWETDIPANRLAEVPRGRRGISADAALRLARWFGTSPEFWMNLRQIYELRRAQAQLGAKIVRSVTPRTAA